jgi:hypothetical protein
MKNYLLILSIYLFAGNSVIACSYGEPTYFDFHQLFIGDGDRGEACNCGISGNLEEWNSFFKNKYKDDISNIVFNYSIKQVEELLKTEKKKKYKQAFEYLIYAKELGLASDRIGGNVDPYSWEYEEILKKPFFKESLLDKGIKGFKKAKDKRLKMRYAYQIVRYLHYSRKYKEAISFYEKNVPQLNLKNELYYYSLDQISGCYFSDGQTAQAAYGFLKVIENSKDRKESARLSFSIHSSWDFDSLLVLCQNKKEQVQARLLVTSEYYNYSDAEWILKNAFDEEALLSIYYYNDVHEEGKYYWMELDNYKKTSWYNDDDEIARSKDINIIQQILAHPETTKKDFWSMCLAYLYHQQGDLIKANNTINKIKEVTIVSKDRLGFFKRFYAASGKNKITDEVENELFDIRDEHLKTLKGSEHNLMLDVYYTMLKTFYLSKKESLKAGLITLSKEGADQIYDLKQLSDLKNLYERKDKNKMELYLLAKSLGNGIDITDYVNEKTASYYLMTNEFYKAREYFKKVPKDYNAIIGASFSEESKNYQFNGYSNIPKQIFSINIKEGFQFNVDKMLTDKTYKNLQFNFIKDEFTKQQLNEYLIMLTHMANNGNVNANYVLGNYYYNNSQFGYFRNVLIYYPDNNYCSDCRTDEMLSEYNEYSNKHYAKALELSSNKEFKARITYFMAKNRAFSSTFNGYSNNEDKYIADSRLTSYYGLFEDLNSTYRDTKFYQEIIGECKTFNYYVNH